MEIIDRTKWIELLQKGYRRLSRLIPEDIKVAGDITTAYNIPSKMIAVYVVGYERELLYYMFPLYRTKSGDWICRRWDAWNQIYRVRETADGFIGISKAVVPVQCEDD